jgi:hypothetical protein
MSEFQNRIDAQRTILKIINSAGVYREQLFGLSEKAISRWATSNGLLDNSPIVGVLLKLARRLFFLATKSQEQVTEDYKLLSLDVTRMCSILKNLIQKEQLQIH